jgi:hypothetical protein
VYRLAVELVGRPGEPELVGLCPAFAAGPGCDGGLLEARLAAAAARRVAGLAGAGEGEEPQRLAGRLAAESTSLAALAAAQDDLLAGAERAAALVRVLGAAGLADAEAEAMLRVAAAGLRAGLVEPTTARFRARVALLDDWLANAGRS